jgi:hypothetical protein
MEYHIGKRVPFPDVSNTRYGSHGEAAATIIVYREHFVRFMEHVCAAKDKPVMTNIEKNFTNALTDIPTLTELCVLALYNIAVSRPFMSHVRSHENILQLEEFFKRKASFLDTIIQTPNFWTGNETTHENASLLGKEWCGWDRQVLTAVKELQPQLPDLNAAIVAFVTGARETFVGRFSDEFKKGNGIDELTPTERDTLYFASTNDANEGGLGSWRRGQVRRPAETLHKFNSSFMSKQNKTEDFMGVKLTNTEDDLYLMRVARKRDASGLQKKLKAAQIQADQEKVMENRQKEAKRDERLNTRAAILLETSKNLVLDGIDIDKLNNDELNRQLDYHRDLEKKLPLADNGGAIETVPLKSHMKLKHERVAELKKAVTRHLARTISDSTGTQDSDSAGQDLSRTVVLPDNDIEYQSDHNDDLT